jgi:hypothetical protein
MKGQFWQSCSGCLVPVVQLWLSYFGCPTVAKPIGNRSDRRKIKLFITNISASYSCILGKLSIAKILVVGN